MAINVPNPGTYLSGLGQHVTAFRDSLQILLNDAAYLNSMGGAAFLQAAPFDMDAADAATIMNTVGAVTAGDSVVQDLQGFIEATEPLWGGQ